jgi:epoxyqueuosine reductase QueG
MTEREIWQGKTPFNDLFGPFSHRHAATRAGLGEFGCCNVVLTREFGPRQRFNSIITDAELVGDPLITEPICRRDACRLCQEACHMSCITMRDDPSVVDYRSVDKVDRDTIFIDTPARTDPTVCRQRSEGRPDHPLYGECIRVCPVAPGRRYLSDRLKALVRRREG